MAIVTYSAVTSSNWTVPANVYSIYVECWGGGGIGGRRITNGAGGGGGGGAYSAATISTTPGTIYWFNVGAGGTVAGNSGVTSQFTASGGTVLVSALGGTGCPDNTATGQNGGSAASGVGDLKYGGGRGGNGTAGSNGGGGGESGAPSGNGGTGSGATPGGLWSDGGNGGSGSLVHGTGNIGATPGGGGGGALRTSTGVQVGGSGFTGQVRITYNAISTLKIFTSYDDNF